METGKNIQEIAKIVYVVMLVIAILLGLGGVIAGFAMFDSNIMYAFIGVGGGIVVGALGIFSAWVAKNMISGYGEIVENTAVIRENTAK
jgi:hypothetical protein